MMENFLDDLIDYAEIDNNLFSFNKEFFNIGDTIYEAF